MAAGVARECELDEVLSLDMGGTTDKICLIPDGVPESSRSFETARVYRSKREWIALKGAGDRTD